MKLLTAGVVILALLSFFSLGLTLRALAFLPRAIPVVTAFDPDAGYQSGLATARVIIPSLGVRAEAESVGITKKGDMGNPKDPFKVAWFNLGAKAGEQGSVVIAGHVETRKGAPAVFFDLEKLAIGNEIFLEDEAGNFFRYRVIRKKLFPFDASDTAEIFENDQGAFLNLITCAGDWVPTKKLYDERLVVFTELAEHSVSKPR